MGLRDWLHALHYIALLMIMITEIVILANYNACVVKTWSTRLQGSNA